MAAVATDQRVLVTVSGSSRRVGGPRRRPVVAVVVGMEISNVDTVLIAGRVMKRGGQLLHVVWPAVRQTARESRDFVVAKSGFKLPKI